MSIFRVRGRLPPLYAHCLGGGATPRLTITTHPLQDGEAVWYLGGQIAETGIERSSAEQIAAGREALSALLPWLDLESRCGLRRADHWGAHSQGLQNLVLNPNPVADRGNGH